MDAAIEAAIELQLTKPHDALTKLEVLLTENGSINNQQFVSCQMVAARCYYQLGKMTQALHCSTLAVDSLDGSCTSFLAAKAKNVHGGILVQLANYAEASKWLERAAGDALGTGDFAMLGLILVNQGAVCSLLGDHAAGIELFEEARRLLLDTPKHVNATIAQANIADAWLLAAREAEAQEDQDGMRTCAKKAVDTGLPALTESENSADQYCQLNVLHTLVSAMLMLDEVKRPTELVSQWTRTAPSAFLELPAYRATQAALDVACGRPAEAVSLLKVLAESKNVIASAETHLHILNLLCTAAEKSGDYMLALETQKRCTRLIQQASRRIGQEQGRRFRQIARDQHDETLGFLAHDLRSPLVSILALCADTSRVSDPASATASERRIASLAGRALQLTDTFLEVARLDRLQAQTFDTIDMATVAEGACDEILLVARRCGKHLTCALEFGSWFTGNAPAMHRALSNLIHNALSASAVGGTVSVTVSKSKDSTVVVAVEDRGKGMPARAQAVLRSTVNSVAGPVGPKFGLAIVAKVARAHGSQIEIVTSSLGTNIQLKLPLIQAPAELLDS